MLLFSLNQRLQTVRSWLMLRLSAARAGRNRSRLPQPGQPERLNPGSTQYTKLTNYSEHHILVNLKFIRDGSLTVLSLPFLPSRARSPSSKIIKMADSEWKPIGMSVQATEDGPPVEVIESLCMECHEQASNPFTLIWWNLLKLTQLRPPYPHSLPSTTAGHDQDAFDCDPFLP